jgi:hypothetical protein
VRQQSYLLKTGSHIHNLPLIEQQMATDCQCSLEPISTRTWPQRLPLTLMPCRHTINISGSARKLALSPLRALLRSSILGGTSSRESQIAMPSFRQFCHASPQSKKG